VRLHERSPRRSSPRADEMQLEASPQKQHRELVIRARNLRIVAEGDWGQEQNWTQRKKRDGAEKKNQRNRIRGQLRHESEKSSKGK